VILEVSKKLFSLKSVKDTIYWYSKDFTILLSEKGDNYVLDCQEWDEESKNEFIRSLNDFSLRDIIASETKEIRQIIATKAFYPDFVKFKPVGGFDDPLNMEKNETK
jgi:His-Xaa-Ser system protein HxsD